MRIVKSVNLKKLEIRFIKNRSAKLNDILLFTLKYFNIDGINRFSNNILNAKARFFYMTFANIYTNEKQNDISIVVDRDRTSLISGSKRCKNKYDLKFQFEHFENYMIQKMNIKKILW